MFDDKDLEEYDTYLKVVKNRIKELNNRTTGIPKDHVILIHMIDIDHIKDKKDGDWEFQYHIDTTPYIIGSRINGFIRYEDFHTWKRVRLQKKRDEKLKQLGI